MKPSSFFVASGICTAKSRWSISRKAGFDDAFSCRYAVATFSASDSGVKCTRVLSAVEYWSGVSGISLRVFAVEMGLMEGMTVSAMARSVFHCAGVSGSAEGNGGSGAAFGETGWVGKDMETRWMTEDGVKLSVLFKGVVTARASGEVVRLPRRAVV
jgi:hypothetical protein